MAYFLRRGTEDPGPEGWVLAEAYDPGFDEGDSNYHSLISASDGRIYFTVSTHRHDRHARLFCFDPSVRKMVYAIDIGVALQESPGHLPHGKVHVPLFEVDGKIYFATHVGYYQQLPGSRAVYPGFHILLHDMSTGSIVDLYRGPHPEGLISAVMDSKRMIYYGLTWPSGLLVRCAITCDKLQVSPSPCASDTDKLVRTKRICRALGLDDQGFVYGSCVSGSIWRCTAEGQPRLVPGVNVLQGAISPISRRGRSHNAWREVIWDDADRCFYGIHAGTQSLFRFQPHRKKIEPLARLGTEADRTRGHAPYGSQLGLAIGPDRVIYHLAHGPPVGRRNRMRRSVYLVSYDLARSQVKDHGPVRLVSGEQVIFAESLTSDPAGNLYSVAWVEVSDPNVYGHFKRLRNIGSNGECRGYVYQMMLIRILR